MSTQFACLVKHGVTSERGYMERLDILRTNHLCLEWNLPCGVLRKHENIKIVKNTWWKTK